jgi:hypothetical protein
LPGISGSLKYSPPGSGDGIDVDAENIIDALQMTFMVSGEARKGAWAGFTDVIYLRLEGDKDKSVTLPSGATVEALDANLELTGWVWTFGGSYTAWRKQQSHLDLLVGARLLSIDTELKLSGGGPGQAYHKLSEGVDVWDGLIGVKGRLALNERWFLPYYADVGAGDSKLTWQALGGVGYAFDWGDVTLEYRHLEYDQEDDKLLQDIGFSGGMLGAVFRF